MEQKKNNISEYVFLHVVLVIYSLGSVCSKIAAEQEFLSFKFFIAYGAVLIILFGYAIVWQQILKKFDLTVAFANKAVVIVWGILWGMLLFNEKITWNMVLGAIVIMIGIWMVAKDNEN